MPYHVLRDHDRNIVLAIVYLEPNPSKAMISVIVLNIVELYSPYKVRQNCTRTSLRPDGDVVLKSLLDIRERHEERT